MVEKLRRRLPCHTEQKWRAILKRYAAGESAAKLARATGVSAGSIYRHAAALGIRKHKGLLTLSRRRILKRVHRPAAVWEAAFADYEAGATARAVCEARGLNIHTFKNKRHAAGRTRKAARAARAAGAPPPGTDAATAWAAWRRCAHAAQLPPEGAWRTWLFQGGRGAGKTRAGAEWIAAYAAQTPHARIALVGASMRDVREVMVEGPSGLLNLPGQPPPLFEPSRCRLEFLSGAVAYGFSACEPERLRGPQFDAAWADEFCAWRRPGYALQMLRLGLRLGDLPRLVVTTTPKPLAALRAVRGESSCVVTQAGTAANAAHLAPAFVESLRDIYGDTRFAAQELDGVLVEGDAPLWRAADLAAVRGGRPPAFDEVIVAVDPPSGEGASACGVIVAGRIGRRGFVLADESVKGAAPLAWAQRAAAAARTWGARRIVAEVNQGGAMVRAMLAAAEAPCAVEMVHATESKRARAAPVAALYAQGRVTHCGAFVALEEEMMALSTDGEGRRDRVDALVWALTSLLVELPPASAPPSVRQL